MWCATICSQTSVKFLSPIAIFNNSTVFGISAQIKRPLCCYFHRSQLYRANSLVNYSSCFQLTEFIVGGNLDSLIPTATGLPAIIAWFLRVGAKVFAAPLVRLLNQSMVAGVVPKQLKVAAITPVPKTTKTAQCSEFRPI